MPDGITHVVCDKHGATPVHDDAHRSTLRLATLSQKLRQKRLCFPLGLTSIGYFDGDNLVTTWRVTVPGAALRNDGVVFKTWNGGIRVESEPE